MKLVGLAALLLFTVSSTSIAQDLPPHHAGAKFSYPVSVGYPMAAQNPQYAKVLTHALGQVVPHEGRLPVTEDAPHKSDIIHSYVYAARQGNALAQFKLGQLFLDGELLERDHRKALTWFTASAEQGFLQAQLLLSSMYLQGIGTDKDPLMARKWIDIAISLSERTDEQGVKDFHKTTVF